MKMAIEGVWRLQGPPGIAVSEEAVPAPRSDWSILGVFHGFFVTH